MCKNISVVLYTFAPVMIFHTNVLSISHEKSIICRVNNWVRCVYVCVYLFACVRVTQGSPAVVLYCHCLWSAAFRGMNRSSRSLWAHNRPYTGPTPDRLRSYTRTRINQTRSILSWAWSLDKWFFSLNTHSLRISLSSGHTPWSNCTDDVASKSEWMSARDLPHFGSEIDQVQIISSQNKNYHNCWSATAFTEYLRIIMVSLRN